MGDPPFMSEKPALRPLWSSVRKLALYCRAQRRDLASVAALGGISASLAAVEPLTLKVFFDRLVAKQTAGAAVPFVVFLSILVARELIACVHDRAFWRARLGISF